MWKWVLGGFAALVILCGGGGYLLVQSPGFKQLFETREKVVEVFTEPVFVRQLTRTVNAPGTVEPRSDVQISAQVQARIESLPFEIGDPVRKDQIVVQLDSEDLQAALESAKANLKIQQARQRQADIALSAARTARTEAVLRLDAARARLSESESEADRVRVLYESNDVTLSELEQAESVYLQRQAETKQAEASIERADQEIQRVEAEQLAAAGSVENANQQIRQRQKDLDNATILAPIDGVITALNAEEGELVVIGTLNNAASVILEIADLNQMLLKARVDEANVASVEAGQRVTVYVNAYPDEPFEGEVERVGLKKLTWTDNTNYFECEVRISLREGQRLRAGLTASCDIEVETVQSVLQVPSQAVLDRRVDELPGEIREAAAFLEDAGTFASVVFVIEDGKASARPVRIGISDLTHTAILEGLAPDARVIVGPYKALEELQHGDAVRDLSAPAPAEVAERGTAGTEEAKAGVPGA